MNITTTRDCIRSVVARWTEQYPDDKSVAQWLGRPRGDVRRALEVLDLEVCAAADVDAIIGNGSWTTLECDECERKVSALVNIGKHREHPVSICEACAIAAVSALTTPGPIADAMTETNDA